MLRSGGVPLRHDTRRPLSPSDASLSLHANSSASLQPRSSSLGREMSSRPKHSVHHPLGSSFAGCQKTTSTNTWVSECTCDFCTELHTDLDVMSHLYLYTVFKKCSPFFNVQHNRYLFTHLTYLLPTHYLGKKVKCIVVHVRFVV